MSVERLFRSERGQAGTVGCVTCVGATGASVGTASPGYGSVNAKDRNKVKWSANLFPRHLYDWNRTLSLGGVLVVEVATVFPTVPSGR